MIFCNKKKKKVRYRETIMITSTRLVHVGWIIDERQWIQDDLKLEHSNRGSWCVVGSDRGLNEHIDEVPQGLLGKFQGSMFVPRDIVARWQPSSFLPAVISTHSSGIPSSHSHPAQVEP